MGKFYRYTGDLLIDYGTCPDGDEQYQAVEGLELGLGDPPSWLRTGTYVEPPKPVKLRNLREFRERKLNGTFVWNGHAFDCDPESQTRLMGMYVSAVNTPSIFPVNWRLADNSWLTLSASDGVDVWTSLQQHVSNCFTVFAMHETNINALQTDEEIEAYDFTTGW